MLSVLTERRVFSPYGLNGMLSSTTVFAPNKCPMYLKK